MTVIMTQSFGIFREMELRRRKKEENRTKTELKIQEIKRKSAEAEEKKEFNSRLYQTLLPFTVGAIMVFGAAGYYYMR